MHDPVDQVPFDELASRDVHRHGDRRPAGILPRLVLSAGGMNHPVADGHDQPGLFGLGNEFDGRDHAEFGMLPADQCLHADDLT
ncbi:hypothetical protein D3C76_1081880 [compost metagenome]